MSIIRIKKEANYTVLDNTFINDQRLNWQQKGLMCYLLSLPDNWEINLRDLTKRSASGRDATANTLNSLIEFGYVAREKERDTGKFAGYDYKVYEKPYTENPNTVKPNTENPTQVNTNIVNTEIISTDTIEAFFEQCWTLYPKKQGKGQIQPKRKKIAYELGEEFKRCIERYKQDKKDTPAEYLQYGSTFWNGGYVDYLDANYVKTDNDIKERLKILLRKYPRYSDIPEAERQGITLEQWNDYRKG